MKIYFTFFLALITLCDLSAQATIKENFETYDNGDLITIISSDWQLWPGGKDTWVTSSEAASGTKSLKLEGGRGTDLYLPFKRRFTAGSIQLSMDFLVPEGSKGYFSLQGDEKPGVVWSVECYLDPDGLLRMVDNRMNKFTSTFPQDKWFTLSIDINFENHLWRFYINDECVGSYIQSDIKRQSVASLALFPDSKEKSVFYVDNIDFVHKGLAEEISLKNDAVLTAIIDPDDELATGARSILMDIEGSPQNLGFTIANYGEDPINSMDLTLEHKGETSTHSFRVNLQEDTTLTLDKKLIHSGRQTLKLTIDKINGLANENSCNNSLPINLKGFKLHPDRKVFVEEATGTWCGFCPRGHIYMSYMQEKYPDHFVGVAVHNGDPMELLPWMGKKNIRQTKGEETKSGLFNFIKGFPSVLINRGEAMDPTLMELSFLEAASMPPSATLTHKAKWNAQTRELQVTVIADLLKPSEKDVRLVVGLTENKVSGTGNNWNQTNYYAGKPAPMGGYEILPGSIPDMQYDHVARALLTSFNGELLTFKEAPLGEAGIRTFTQTIPGDWNLEEMHIVSSLVSGKEFLNANKTSILEVLSTSTGKK